MARLCSRFAETPRRQLEEVGEALGLTGLCRGAVDDTGEVSLVASAPGHENGPGGRIVGSWIESPARPER